MDDCLAHYLWGCCRLQFTSGVNDVELSLELAGTALNVATGHYSELYGDAYEHNVGFRHQGFLKTGGNLVMKVYEVSVAAQGQNMSPAVHVGVL